MKILFSIVFLLGFLNAQVIEVNRGWKLIGASEDIVNMNNFNASCVSSVFSYKNSRWSSYMPNKGGDLAHIANEDGFWVSGVDNCEIQTSEDKILNPEIVFGESLSTNLRDAKLFKKSENGFEIVAITDENGIFKTQNSTLKAINEGEIYKIVSDKFNYLDYFFIKNSSFYTYEECDSVYRNTRSLKDKRDLTQKIKLSKNSKPIQSTRGEFSELLYNATNSRVSRSEKSVAEILAELIEKRQAFLQINTRGHIGIITQILVKDNLLITSSEDKTIKIWDLYKKTLIGEIRGEIGDGFGSIQDIELTKDLLIAAVVDTRSLDAKPTVRIYNFKTKEIIQVLKDTSVIKRSDVSEDGEYLATALKNGEIKIYQKSREYIWANNDVSIKTWFNLIKAIKANTSDTNDVKIFKDKDGTYKIISASYDGFIRMFNLNGDLLKSFEHKDARSIAINLNYIATGGYDRVVNILDKDLNLVKSIDVGFRQKNLAFSPNGEYLLTSAWDNDRKIETKVYQMSDFSQVSSFDKQIENLGGVAFLDNQTAITAGGYDAQEIYMWNIKNGESLGKLIGFGAPVTSVSIDGANILFGNEVLSDVAIKSHTKANTRSFSLENFILKNNEVNNSKVMPLTYGKYSLSHKMGGRYNDLDAILVLTKNQENYKEILRDSSANGFVHKVYGFSDGGLIISGGHVGILKAYDLNGSELASFEGHTDTIMALSSHKHILVSGSKDNIIKIWDLREIGSNKTIYPVLNIFVGSCGEWVMWNRDGYFTSSYNGGEFVGYHINQGQEKEAKFIEFGKIYEYFFRPDLITKDIEKLFN